ncbi:P-loop containing nucleoside triphosphate hydrolase protein [Polychytrium aggregatum]|uniref:P-loop containing nucleoside triphosphate hydrolase protein n=1 Tax=Polychytrium aggregatum TaxID=110093 RepID=UPI0022FED332|nr:P-loop containing nucleoside triphosphate hydrolase protein [Polychytrium aggregatum]KAI9208483.1 P-loop containing nucleoside triphosphate hydrolase protein [Polychytrium aggregatum]
MPPTDAPQLAGIDADAEIDPVALFSYQQPWPQPGDPLCCVCGRYGAYICDVTDHDVCSLECKAADLEQYLRTITAHRSEAPGQSRKPPTPPVRRWREPPLPPPSPELRVNRSHLLRLMRQSRGGPARTAPWTQIAALVEPSGITVAYEGTEPLPLPIAEFSQAPALPAKLLSNMALAGLRRPGPTQRMAIPSIMDGLDVLLTAPNDGDRSLCYIIPAISFCAAISTYLSAAKSPIPQHQKGPYVLIMAPTREHCVQIEDRIKALASGIERLKTVLLAGGCPLPNQLHRLEQGIQIAIATPGRLASLLASDSGKPYFESLAFMVVDGTEGMIEGSTKEQMSTVRKLLPGSKRIRVWCASMASPGVLDLCIKPGPGKKPKAGMAKSHATETHTLWIHLGAQLPTIQNEGAKVAASHEIVPDIPESVKHTFLWVETPSKPKQLISIVTDTKYFRPQQQRLLVFVECRIGAEMLAKCIKTQSTLKAVVLHGEKTSRERETALEQFTEGQHGISVCVATGVMARSIAVEADLVLNYDMALSVASYIHQIRRCRPSKDKLGWAITFINRDHEKLIPELVAKLNQLPAGTVTPLPAQMKRHQRPS